MLTQSRSGEHRVAPARTEWDDLMQASRAGNGHAYWTLLEQLRKWFVRYYRRRLPEALVDDAVQEALLAVHEKRHSLEPSRPIHPWIAAIARYKWVDQIRDIKRRAMDALPEDLPSEDHERAVLSASALKRLMTALNPAQADAIRLVKLEGYSVVEASRLTGQSNASIKMNIHRGLAKLSAMVRQSSVA